MNSYIPQEIQLINIQLFIYISVTLISSWGLSSLGYMISATVYYVTQTSNLTSKVNTINEKNAIDDIETVKIVILILSALLFAVHLRANEVQMRAFLMTRDESSVLAKLVSILKCLPDGILIAD